MASGASEPVYSISVFTYERPDRRARYYVFCGWLARATNLYDARLHWGKHFAQSAEDVERLYPELPVFKGICDGVDPGGVFRNEYTWRVLGMPPGQPSVPRKCVHEVA